MTYQTITTQSLEGVLTITLNRPEAYNALNTQLLSEVADVLDLADQDESIRVAVITGGPKVFAAGADIKEMAALDAVGVMNDPRPKHWKRIYQFSKPLIGAVNGYALGGGCELVMHCDIVIAGDNALFGQPEINLGIIPGAGGTQRLIRTVGKPLAMKMVLSGEMIDAQTALQANLVAEVVIPERTIDRAHQLANTIAKKPPIAVRLAKEALLKAFETDLESGLNIERKSFTMLAATEDRREGIAAFMEKRKPEFKGR
ncbi:2,3-dehydroadipyl-CoA hydratase PaaF [Oceanospirillum linum]|uniref:2,3-dehydroadipyl-CoA hydratase n=1 Tax=Oceanospirillum linum TaxID=966 RepID=A0A1T1HCI2_OCELI|nr:2,3-dehydroadipyl-CoA hydratase PaaF [Oceanospirillum linum]OOV87549.1 2,3-dehydroadipyl-CoA hydratase [Oceanospirillum linum]SEF91419.1 short chain enoyl-CoA hydratase [Oleiphilus messinensis]SMP13096.1 short chain enoyl-CoA hydratase [Oceanospirillum linum]